MASEPSVLILTGYGLNCEAESRAAWERAGARVTLLHLNDLFEAPARLHDHQALMFIGGFSFGDHMGSGHVFAARLRHRMQDDLSAFVTNGGLVLGVCNGFQIMVKLGLLPGLDGDYAAQRLALVRNDVGHFQNFWVEIGFEPGSPCVFTRGLTRMALPIRHGEGELHVPDRALLKRMQEAGCIACRYVDPATGLPTQKFPHNPNGSVDAIAGVCDPSGRVFGLMPHPEAFLYPWNHPQYDVSNETMSQEGGGLRMFQNAVAWLRRA